jgi:hypothetical protein
MFNKKKSEKTKNVNEIDIDDLIKDIYKKIAEWHNDDSTSAGLKIAVLDIIESCTKNTLRQIGMDEIVLNVKLDEETKREALSKQKQQSEN